MGFIRFYIHFLCILYIKSLFFQILEAFYSFFYVYFLLCVLVFLSFFLNIYEYYSFLRFVS